MSCFEEIIGKSLVTLHMAQDDSSAAIKSLIEAAVASGLLPAANMESVVRAVLNRELSASTALPDGIALPHGRTEHVSEIVCVFGVHPTGVDFNAPDGRPTHVLVLLLVPSLTACSHIHFLANLSRCLMEASVRNDLMAAQTRDDFIRILLQHSGEGLSR